MNAYVCVCIHNYDIVCVQVCTCTYVYVCMSMCVFESVYVCVYMHTCVLAFVRFYVCGEWEACGVNADGINCHIQCIILVVMAIMYHIQIMLSDYYDISCVKVYFVKISKQQHNYT